MWFDRLLARQVRGMARVRALLRCAYPVTLIRVRTMDGLTFGVDPQSYMDRIVIKSGYYEREVLEAILAHLPSDGILWDVGANFGLHAITTKHLRPNATIVAFEPVPFTAARVMMNAKLNNLDVDVYSIALGSAAGYSRLSVKLVGNSGVSSLIPWHSFAYDDTMMCHVEKGDALVSASTISSPSVIKMDVEGYELQVLEGLTHVLQSPTLRAVVFESHGKDLQPVTKLLEASDFKISPLEPTSSYESSPAPNYLAVRVW